MTTDFFKLILFVAVIITAMINGFLAILLCAYVLTEYAHGNMGALDISICVFTLIICCVIAVFQIVACGVTYEKLYSND